MQHIPLPPLPEYTPEERLHRALAHADHAASRRSVRDFSNAPVPKTVIEACIRTAGSAPSGANRQPWHFVAVGDVATKTQIRVAAEKEERAFYGGRASSSWLQALQPLGTTAEKPFLDIAPWLIVVFAQKHGDEPEAGGQHLKNYYVNESVGMACGLLLGALHHVGLATLTHTPSPMGFLRDILKRPTNERAYVLLVVGLAAAAAQVPDIRRKPLNEISTFV